MNRQRIMLALVVTIAVGVIGAVIYLERSEATSASTTTTTSTTTPSTTTSTSTTTTSSTTTTTTTATTLPPTTLPPTTLPPPERALVPVVVASGSPEGQRVGPTAFLLGVTGWTNVRALNGSLPLTDTVVFYVDGAQASAELMAGDMSIALTATAPISQAPPVAGLDDAQLLVYLGGA